MEDDLEQAMNELDKLQAKRIRAKDAYDAALAEEHEAIRKILKAGKHGTQAALAQRTGYSRQHLDRIRRGKTSG